MKKGIKNTVGLVIAGFAIYHSVYFRSLDEKIASEQQVVFDAKSYVNGIWAAQMRASYDSSTNLTILFEQLTNDSESTFQREAQALGIGNIGYFKVQGEGTVVAVNENNVMLQVGDQMIEIETEFIFGNAVRDASGLIQINDYDETSDFNSISEAINDKIRKEVIPNFRANVSKGDQVFFAGAIELNRAHLKLNQPEVIPVSLQIVP
jgi:predicted lipoprotein